MRYNRRGKPVTCRVRSRNTTQNVGMEHVMTMWYLYALDGLTYEEIGRMYGQSESTICKRLRSIKRHCERRGTEADDKVFERAIRYNEVLEILDKKRRLPYLRICRQTGMQYRLVKAIAERNGLER